MLKWVHTQLRLAKGAKGSSSADISLLLLISCSPLLVSNDLGLGPEVELKQTFFFLSMLLTKKISNCSFRNAMCDNVYSDFAFYRISQKNEKVCCLRL
ncbi:hypothetical protein PPACK8108_LOCUS13102 [Phakopsora pachyrhizi]|uniref:Secreted protein n=1 Tax=Phakopsora pachyrhizi TaxID=170000 RepID=A0AAV0B2M1_PHAPC|nr:hypothetical protein PPACK8108_LOCUS13099 [Phakopsora pachyrhizi]CAH7678651.1 hypothetical protein PPACK8108_LOCUS13102 [Phakopsora pachyrhizi]